MSPVTKVETDKQAITEIGEISTEDNPDISSAPLLPQAKNEVASQQDKRDITTVNIQGEARQVVTFRVEQPDLEYQESGDYKEDQKSTVEAQQAQSVVSYEQEHEYPQPPIGLEERTMIKDEIAERDRADISNTHISIGEAKTPTSTQEIYDPEEVEVVAETHGSIQEDVTTDQVSVENPVIPQLENEILTERLDVRFDEATLQESEPHTAIAADAKIVAEFSAGIVPHENTPVTSVVELQDLLDTFPGIEKDEPHLFATEEGNEVISAKEAQAETEFIGQLAQYVQSLPENPERLQAEQPIVILAEMVRTAQEIHIVQNHSIEADNLEAEHAIMQEKTEELQQLCVKLFRELGIEADEEAAARIVNALIAHVAANEKVEQSPEVMSVEELAQQGTHEYKLASWFNQFFSYSKPLPHLVGTAALRLSKLSTSI